METDFRPIRCTWADYIISPGIWELMRRNAVDTEGKQQMYNSYAYPVLLWQMSGAMVLCQLITFIIKPFRLPPVVASIMAGILVGPSFLGQIDDYALIKLLFPRSGEVKLYMAGYLGMFLFLFLVGVQCNVRVIGRLGKKVFVIAAANLFVPFIVGLVACHMFGVKAEEGVPEFTFHFYISIIPCLTAFPVLARLVTELKFLNTEIGRLALYSAIVTDFLAWILVSFASFLPTTTIDTDDVKPMQLAILWMLLSAAAFTLVCWFVIRPLMCWFERKIPEGEQVSDMHLGLVIVGALGAGFLLDAVGLHAIMGGFLVGMMVPKGVLTDALVKRMESFVVGVLLPVFFLNTGTDVDLSLASYTKNPSGLIGMFLIVTLVKLIGTMLVAYLFSMPLLQGLSLGLLMCAKGEIELIIINMASAKEILPLGVFTVLVLGVVITTMICIPSVAFLAKRTQGRFEYRRLTLQSMRPDTELRVVACIHTLRNVPSVLGLLKLSQSAKRSPIFVCVLHLIELINRSTTTVIIQDNAVSGSNNQNMLTDSSQSGIQSERIVAAFKSLERNVENISVQPLTAISPYSTMHEDICNIAEEHHMTLIILPFHMLKTASGAMQAPIAAVRNVNLHVLDNAPCSVGILIDRGLGGTMGFGMNNNNNESHQIVVLFFGGGDDREALTYALRLANNSRVTLTLVRFIFRADGAVPPSPLPMNETQAGMTMIPEAEMERRLDDRCVNEFRLKTVSDETVIYTEIVVDNSEDTVLALKAMCDYYDVYLVGRGKGRDSQMLSGMAEWMEYPELGIVGDYLLSPDFGALVSILVLQQHIQ